MPKYTSSPRTRRQRTDFGDDEDFKRLVERSDLTGVRTLRYTGEVLDEHLIEASNLNFRVIPALRQDKSSASCRYNFEARLLTSTNEIMARIEADVVAVFQFRSDAKPTRHLMSRFVEQVGYYVVFPYAREAIQAMALRLGLGPLTLGLLQGMHNGPTSASFPAAAGASASDHPSVRK